MTQEIAALPATLLEKLKSLSSVDEVTQVLMSMAATREITITAQEPSEANRLYDQLYSRFIALEDSMISRQEAAERYKISLSAVTKWGRKGYVRQTDAKRRGLDAYVNERDTATLAEVNHRMRTSGGGPIPGFKPPVRQPRP